MYSVVALDMVICLSTTLEKKKKPLVIINKKSKQKAIMVSGRI